MVGVRVFFLMLMEDFGKAKLFSMKQLFHSRWLHSDSQLSVTRLVGYIMVNIR